MAWRDAFGKPGGQWTPAFLGVFPAYTQASSGNRLSTSANTPGNENIGNDNPAGGSILKQAFERLNLLRQRAVGAGQILDLAHRVQDGGVVASAEAPADLGQ